MAFPVVRSWRAAWVGLVVGAVATYSRGDDNAVLAALRARLAEINAEAQASQDSTEQARLQKVMTETIDQSLVAISPEARPLLAVMLKVVAPLQTANSAYEGAANRFFRAGGGAFETITSREDVQNRASAVEQLATSNQDLRTRVEAVEMDAAQVLRETMPNLTPAERMAYASGMRESLRKQFADVRAVRQIESEAFTCYRSAFALLDAQWGRWRIDPSGAVAWEDDAAATAFRELQAKLETIAARQAPGQG